MAKQGGQQGVWVAVHGAESGQLDRWEGAKVGFEKGWKRESGHECCAMLALLPCCSNRLASCVQVDAPTAAMSARRPFRPPARLWSVTQPAAAGGAATAGAAPPLQAIFDCLFMRGKKAAQEGSLVLAGRTAAVFDLQLREVGSERLPAAVAEALHAAYTAATASGQVQDAPLREEPFSLTVGAVRLEIENEAAAAVTVAEWAVRQRVQQQVAQQVCWPAIAVRRTLHAEVLPFLPMAVPHAGQETQGGP